MFYRVKWINHLKQLPWTKYIYTMYIKLQSQLPHASYYSPCSVFPSFMGFVTDPSCICSIHLPLPLWCTTNWWTRCGWSFRTVKIQGKLARFLLANLSETPHTGMPSECHRHQFSICKAPSFQEPKRCSANGVSKIVSNFGSRTVGTYISDDNIQNKHWQH